MKQYNVIHITPGTADFMIKSLPSELHLVYFLFLSTLQQYQQYQQYQPIMCLEHHLFPSLPPVTTYRTCTLAAHRQTLTLIDEGYLTTTKNNHFANQFNQINTPNMVMSNKI